MTEFYSASSSVSPFTAILWCLYPVAVLVIIELLLGGGFDDDNNDDQDGGMLIPAYSRSDVWIFIVFYDLSLFISESAFLPSLRVLKMSQVREEIIRKVSVIREIWVVSILLINLLKFFQRL